MARNTKKKAVSEENDGKEFFAALDQIEKEKGISKSYMLERITQALITGYKHNHEGVSSNTSVEVEANEEAGTIKMVLRKEVVENVSNPYTEISLEEVHKTLPNAAIGDTIRVEVDTKDFSRIAAQTARQVIIQAMREAEAKMVYDEFKSKANEILTGVVNRIDPRSGAIGLRLSSGHEVTEAFLPRNEQVPGEVYHEGDRVKVYIVEVIDPTKEQTKDPSKDTTKGSSRSQSRGQSKGPLVRISRTHPGLVKRLFELEVPEIYDGTVEIYSIAREAGSRTKIAVKSDDPNVDPIGACVGPRGQRVNTIVDELSGEKIDVIKYSEDPAVFVAAALSPSDVISVTENEAKKSCRVIVPDNQLSLAIGKEGQNARLAAKLTGYKIDIKPESKADEAFEDSEEYAESENIFSDSDGSESAD